MLAIGGKYRKQLEEGLSRCTHKKILWLPDNTDVDPKMAGHADLSIFVGTEGIVVAKAIYPYVVNFLTCTGHQIIPSEDQGPVYPKDAGLCICRTGRYTIYNPKTADRQVVPYLDAERIAVNQGYTRCCVCVVSDEGIITSDHAIASIASKYGLDVLEITPGHILLEGYDYGFIGGASIVLNDRTLAFTGTLDKHPDKASILDFLSKHGKDVVFLSEKPIFDIGGAVALP